MEELQPYYCNFQRFDPHTQSYYVGLPNNRARAIMSGGIVIIMIKIIIIFELFVAMPKSSKQSTHLCHYANYTHKKADFHVGRRQTRITNK